ncbi:hypothetical protein [Roseixanthobacter pseudopolyaromaticivorans]|uniref:hypothetical protein n=1 Tax=Xanthobacteraceae TaxID=335928 RepID=UPI00372BB1CE
MAEHDSETLALDQLRSLCEAISGGRYEDVDVLLAMTGDGALPDTVRRLAEAFGMMIVRVEARELHLEETLAALKQAQALLEKDNRSLAASNEALSAEVHRLRIDISQRDRAVAEIVDTDQFRAVQAMAKRLRDRPL